MKITNKDVIQSYLVTAARYDFNVYEKRILLSIAGACQAQIEGQKLDHRFKINKLLYDDSREIIMPISYLLQGENDKNHSRIKEALISLRNKTFEKEEDGVWEVIGIIEKPKTYMRSDKVKFEIHKDIYYALLDFSKGFRKFELTTAMKFKSIYAMRFYELFSNIKIAITYKIENLKIMFKLESKYKRPSDFIRFVIEPAKTELDKHSPFSFEWKPKKTGRKITAIKFFPYKIAENRDHEVEVRSLKQKVSPSWTLNKIVIDYLKQNYYFESKEIARNIELFNLAKEKLDIMLLLANLRQKCEGKANPKGYLINAIKKEIQAKS